MTPQKINYQKELEKIIAQIEEEKKTTVSFIKPTLLLHACCGPCSSYVIEYLAQIFDITIYYYNPNIHPKEEYFRRLEELKKFLERFPQATQNSVKLVEDIYNPEEYFKATNVRQEVELQSEPEKGERCRRCYLFRMKRAWEYACKNNFDWFTTTLSISPHKDSEKINVIGRELEEQKTNDSSAITIHTKFLPSDFKKKGGFLRSTQLSEEYGLWRQDYCGCVYSQRNGKKDL
ncbi:epoxyqueuosine reductase QueH [Treponema sp. UBA3813]|uniref:epoxyqueuosine reductase QueH n=1 Tax=Treponema sp. UBA3813 TaxID=1947715 RepID=UPI0025E229DA|nr:epoxyqueuosine reductase QueH [Treponema sp. UBA3813]